MYSSSMVIGGTRPFSNIMAPLTLFNEGVPTMRFQNAKMLLRWLFIMHIYGSVGPLKSIFMASLALFNEGVPAHFTFVLCICFDMVLAIAHGIPAFQAKADVCFSKHRAPNEETGMGIPCAPKVQSPLGCRTKGLQPLG